MTSKMVYFNVGKLNEDIKLSSIRLKDMQEVFQDYKKSALLLSTCFCDWKCCNEAGIDKSVCQNNKIAQQKEVVVSFSSLLKKVRSSITDSIIFAGLEPLLQIDEVVQCIDYLREHNVKKDIIIFTGYYLEEIDHNTLERLSDKRVILKCGRYIPNRPSVFDQVLGITLVSDNQYGVYL